MDPRHFLVRVSLTLGRSVELVQELPEKEQPRKLNGAGPSLLCAAVKVFQVQPGHLDVDIMILRLRFPQTPQELRINFDKVSASRSPPP